MEIANGCLEIFSSLVIFILLIGMYSGRPTEKAEKQMLAMVLCHMVVLLLDATRWFLYQRTDLSVLMVVLSVAPTILALVGHAIFIYFAMGILAQRGPISLGFTVPLFSLFAVALLVWTSLILSNGIESAVNLQVNYDTLQHSWRYWGGHLSWSAVCVIGMILVWHCRKGLNKKELLSFMSYCIFPLIALLLRFFWDGPQIFLSTSLSLIWICVVIYRDQRQRLWEKENQLAQSRISLLLSQIQPHFMYNTLSAICGLCDTSPREAKQVTAEFADYLRHNLESINQSTPIPFSEELQHTKLYLSIEQKRFTEKLNPIYKIETEDFFIPALTVQPLVENAIKHGLMGRRNGGTVTLSTREREDCYEIAVIDNGVGFEESQPRVGDKIHVGIENARARLWSMCRGTLTITSQVGVGTVAVIEIPKPDEEYSVPCPTPWSFK